MSARRLLLAVVTTIAICAAASGSYADDPSPDNCPSVENPDQADGDSDGVGNACDNCPAAANAGQEDADSDGIGDACETAGGLRDYSGSYCAITSDGSFSENVGLTIAQTNETDVTLTFNGAAVLTGTLSGDTIAASGFIPSEVSVSIAFDGAGTFAGVAELPPGTFWRSLTGAPGTCPPSGPCANWQGPTDEEFLGSMVHPYVTALADYIQIDNTFKPTHGGVHFSPIMPFDDAVVGLMTALTVPTDIGDPPQPHGFELMPYTSNVSGCVERIELSQDPNTPLCTWRVGVGIRINDRFSVDYLFEPNPFTEHCEDEAAVQAAQEALVKEVIAEGTIVAPGDLLGWLVLGTHEAPFNQPMMHFDLNDTHVTQGPDDFICPQPGFSCSTLVDFSDLYSWPVNPPNSICDGETLPSGCSDNDDVPDEEDNCPTVDNADQADGDEDGIGNACDNCPAAANADQADADSDNIGDACETAGGLRAYSGNYCVHLGVGGQSPFAIAQSEGDATLTFGEAPNTDVVTGTVTGNAIAATGTISIGDIAVAITFATDGTFTGDAESPPGTPLTSLTGTPGSCPPPDPNDPPPGGPCANYAGPSDEEFLTSMVQPYVPQLATYVRINRIYTAQNPGNEFAPIRPFDDSVVEPATGLTVPTEIGGQAHPFELMPYRAAAAGCVNNVEVFRGMWEGHCGWHVRVAVKINNRFELNYNFAPGPEEFPLSCDDPLDALQQAQLDLVEVSPGDIVAAGDLLGWLITESSQQTLNWSTMMLNLNDNQASQETYQIICPQPYFSCPALADFRSLSDVAWLTADTLCEGETLPAECGDSDSVADAEDNCPTVNNADQADGGEDGIGNACDNCPAAANADQADADSDNIGDACETAGGLRAYSGNYCVHLGVGGQSPFAIAQSEGDATLTFGEAPNTDVVTGTVTGNAIAATGTISIGDIAVAITFATDGTFTGDAESPPGTPLTSLTGTPGSCPPPDPNDPPPGGPCANYAGPSDEEFLTSMVQPYVPQLATYVRINRIYTAQNPGNEFAPIRPFDDSVVEPATGLTVPTEIGGQAHPFELMPYRAAAAGCVNNVEVFRGMWEGHCGWHVRVAVKINNRFELNYNFAPGPEEFPLSCDDPLDALQQAQLDLVQVSPGDIVAAGDLLGWLITESSQQTLNWSTMMLNLNDNQASQETYQIICPQPYFSCPALADFRSLSDVAWLTADTLCEGETLPAECGDSDNDSVSDAEDNCPTVNNADQADGDGDGFGNACDNCPAAANADQADADSDDIGNACETAGGARDYSGGYCVHLSVGGQSPLAIAQSEGDATLTFGEAPNADVLSGTVTGNAIAATGTINIGDIAVAITFANDGTFAGDAESPPGTPLTSLTGAPGDCPPPDPNDPPPPGGPCANYVGPSDEEFLNSMIHPYVTELSSLMRMDGNFTTGGHVGVHFSPIDTQTYNDSVVDELTDLTVPAEIGGVAHPYELLPYASAAAGCIENISYNWSRFVRGGDETARCYWNVAVGVRVNSHFSLYYLFEPGPEAWPDDCDEMPVLMPQHQRALIEHEVQIGDIVAAGDVLGWLIVNSSEEPFQQSTVHFQLNQNQGPIICPEPYFACSTLLDFSALDNPPWMENSMCDGEPLPSECPGP